MLARDSLLLVTAVAVFSVFIHSTSSSSVLVVKSFLPELFSQNKIICTVIYYFLICSVVYSSLFDIFRIKDDTIQHSYSLHVRKEFWTCTNLLHHRTRVKSMLGLMTIENLFQSVTCFMTTCIMLHVQQLHTINSTNEDQLTQFESFLLYLKRYSKRQSI